MNSRRIDFACIYFDFGSFSQKTSPQIDTIQKTPRGSPTPQKGGQRWPTDGQRDTKGTPKGSHGEPKVTQGAQKGSHWSPKMAKGRPRAPKGSQAQSHPKGSQRHPQRHPREAKGSQRDKIYIYKLPINRPSKRYVSIFHICCI